MKLFAVLCLCVTLAMSMIPLLAFEAREEDRQTEREEEFVSKEEGESEQEDTGKYANEEISVYDAESGEVLVLKMRDYLIGSLAAEMPASYHEEALKAQALACFTYAVRTIQEEKKNPTEALQGADLSNDSRVHQAYIGLEQMKERWGDDFSKNYDKLATVVDSVSNKLIVYEDEPIVAVFHAISSGRTERAENIWGGEPYPYLDSVQSEGDVLALQFSTTTIFTEKQFAEIAKKINGVTLPEKAADWLGEIELSETGTVLSCEIGGKKLTGTQVRECFSLRSPTFSLEHDGDGSFSFTVSGYGHGVGMSQYGADYMARQGSSYEDIIHHYYKDVAIVPLK